MDIDLENLEGVPKKFILRLKKYDKIFAKHEFLEHYQDNININQIIVDVNNLCLENSVIGYRFTRAVENDILEKGLITRTGKEIRNDFINRHFHLFTKIEQNEILQRWENRFGSKDIEYRDSRIFFNFTKNAIRNGGAELLLKYYGGEQVYFPLFKLPNINSKLSNIGMPMVLKCKLNPSNIKTYIENPWGKIIVSSYNKIINPKAHVIDQDGYQKVNVKPENIEIIKM